MANDACWDMRVVSKSKEAIERLYRILRYEDEEYFMYGVFEAWHSESDTEWIDEEDGYYVADLWGEVAWGMDAWFDPDEQRHGLYEGPLEGHPNARYATMMELCPLLDIGVEAFCAEPMLDIQQHAIVDHAGTIVLWQEGDDVPDPPEDSPAWRPNNEIYGE